MRMWQRPLDTRDSTEIEATLRGVRLRRNLTVHGHGRGGEVDAVVVVVIGVREAPNFRSQHSRRGSPLHRRLPRSLELEFWLTDGATS